MKLPSSRELNLPFLDQVRVPGPEIRPFLHSPLQTMLSPGREGVPDLAVVCVGDPLAGVGDPERQARSANSAQECGFLGHGGGRAS
jgi:hypothetical protein